MIIKNGYSVSQSYFIKYERSGVNTFTKMNVYSINQQLQKKTHNENLFCL